MTGEGGGIVFNYDAPFNPAKWASWDGRLVDLQIRWDGKAG